MLATIGFSIRVTSRQMRSLARALPPGESTRRTMALTVLSSDASRRCLTTASEPIVASPRIDSPDDLPTRIIPEA